MSAPKCEECEAEGKKPEQIYPGSARSTGIGYQPYYDGDGKYHAHDPNTTKRSFRCSNGHRWNVSSKNPCPTCGKWWQKKE